MISKAIKGTPKTIEMCSWGRQNGTKSHQNDANTRAKSTKKRSTNNEKRTPPAFRSPPNKFGTTLPPLILGGPKFIGDVHLSWFWLIKFWLISVLYWRHFDGFWCHFVGFRGFWCHFHVLLNSFWSHFDVIVKSLGGFDVNLMAFDVISTCQWLHFDGSWG